MLKRILFIVAVLSATSAFAQNDWNWPNYKAYASRNAELMKEKPNDPSRVVFFGNSITEGWPTARPEFFSENDFVGRGISGQTTYQFLLRFRDDVINLKPAAVVINAATNDVAENTCAYDERHSFENIISMVEMAQANGIKVIMTSTLPAGGFGWNPSIKDAMQKIVSLNNLLKNYAKEHKIPYVDYFSSLVSEDGTRMDAAYSGDGVHPNAKGYEIMENLILPQVRKMVKAPKK